MGTDHHTPLDATNFYNSSAHAQLPHEELDDAISINEDAIAACESDIMDNTDDIGINAADIATNVAAIAGKADSAHTHTNPYDIPIMYNGSPTDALVILRLEMVRGVTFPAGLTLSRLKSVTSATGTSAFSLKKNGTEFSTMTFAAAGTTATIAAASETTFAEGDILTLVAPTTADATLADLYGMIVGSR